MNENRPPEHLGEEQLLANAINQFNIVMQFFPRADAKMSTLLGYNLGMLAFLGANSPGFDKWTLTMWILYPVALALIGTSLIYVYRSSYPTILDNKRSLIFFNDIAAISQDDFVTKFRNEYRVNYIDDMLRQVWSNSEILRQRFHFLQQGYRAMALAVLPWLVALTISAQISHSFRF
jgi:hypothetical protein